MEVVASYSQGEEDQNAIQQVDMVQYRLEACERVEERMGEQAHHSLAARIQEHSHQNHPHPLFGSKSPPLALSGERMTLVAEGI